MSQLQFQTGISRHNQFSAGCCSGNDRNLLFNMAKNQTLVVSDGTMRLTVYELLDHRVFGIFDLLRLTIGNDLAL